MPPEKVNSELMQYQIDQLQKAVDLIAQDFDLLHELDKRLSKLEELVGLLQRVVYSVGGVVGVGIVGAVLKLVLK